LAFLALRCRRWDVNPDGVALSEERRIQEVIEHYCRHNLAPEQFIDDREGRDIEHAAVDRFLGVAVEPRPDRRVGDPDFNSLRLVALLNFNSRLKLLETSTLGLAWLQKCKIEPVLIR
jgi:hypothetical protein